MIRVRDTSCPLYRVRVGRMASAYKTCLLLFHIYIYITRPKNICFRQSDGFQRKGYIFVVMLLAYILLHGICVLEYRREHARFCSFIETIYPFVGATPTTSLRNIRRSPPQSFKSFQQHIRLWMGFEIQSVRLSGGVAKRDEPLLHPAALSRLLYIYT